MAYVGSSIASANPLLYATDAGRQELFTLSITNGSGSLIGRFGVAGYMADLTYDSQNDILYGTTTLTDNLYTINRVTGAANLVGPLGVPLMHGLAYDNIHGVLYGTTSTNSALYRISTTTGHATWVGNIGNFYPDPRNGISGLTFNPADNALYGCISGPSYLGGLVRIDTSTGQGTFLYSTQPLTDLDFDPQTGTLYGIDNGLGVHPNSLYTIDLATGTASLVGLTGLTNNLGLAFAPAPRPILSTIPLPPARLQITWPTNFTGYLLESAAAVQAATWTPVTNTIAISNGQFTVTLDADAPQQLFRLRMPQ